jgi:hypothetical protein
MNLLWTVLEDPMGIQDHMHQRKILSSFGFTMQGIVKKYKQGGVPFFDHATSHMKVLTLDI